MPVRCYGHKKISLAPIILTKTYVKVGRIDNQHRHQYHDIIQNNHL
uniref:Uncharacterized protein n=1 Tax=Arundo donax TaxID=35708 RepID=A0A0A9CP72_ARUDO